MRQAAEHDPLQPPHLAPPQSAVALLRADEAAGRWADETEAAVAAVGRPKLVLIERVGARAVVNGAELRDALATLPVDVHPFHATGSQVGKRGKGTWGVACSCVHLASL